MKYTFTHHASLIKELEIFRAGKELKAVLYAPEGSQAGRLPEVRRKMEENGFNVLVDHENGKDILRVDGFKSAEHFLSAMADDGAVFGDYKAAITEREVKEKKTLGQLVKDNSLTLAGWAYIIADTLVIAAGAKRKDIAEIFNGVLWWIPSLFLMAAGKQNPADLDGFMKRDFIDELEKNNIKIPTETLQALRDNSAQHSNWAHFVELVYDHGPVMNNIMQMLGGSQKFAAGLAQDNLSKQAAGLLVFTGMGAGVLATQPGSKKYGSSMLGTGQLESPDGYSSPEMPRPGSSREKLTQAQQMSEILSPPENEGIFSKINPLSLSGGGAFIQNILGLVGAIHEIRNFKGGKGWKHGLFSKNHLQDTKGNLFEHKSEAWLTSQRDEMKSELHDLRDQIGAARQNDNNFTKLEADYTRLNGLLSTHEKGYAKTKDSYEAAYLDAAASAIYMIANSLYFISSKENRADLNSIGAIDNMMAVAANIIAGHPKHERAELMPKVATMLSHNKYIDYTVQDIMEVLNTKVEALDKSPWLSPQAVNNIVPITRKPQPESAAVAASADQTQPESSVIEMQRASLERLVENKAQQKAQEGSSKRPADTATQRLKDQQLAALAAADQGAMAVH